MSNIVEYDDVQGYPTSSSSSLSPEDCLADDGFKIQVKSYLKRSNNIPMQSLNWLSPLQMRQNIIEANASIANEK